MRLEALRYQPMLWSLQHIVVESTPEFNISNLFWDTEYCISVEPDVASRCIRATRTEEQCVTIGETDSKWQGNQESGEPCGTRILLSLLALGDQLLRAPAAAPSRYVHRGLCLSSLTHACPLPQGAQSLSRASSAPLPSPCCSWASWGLCWCAPT